MRYPAYPDEYLLFGALLAVGNRLQTLGDCFYKELTSKQWFLLAAMELFEEEDPTLGELAAAAGCSHQNAKQLALKLEAKGYVRLVPDVNDRRKSRVCRTPRCAGLLEKYEEKQAAFMAALFEGVPPPSLRAALEALERLNENMEHMLREEKKR